MRNELQLNGFQSWMEAMRSSVQKAIDATDVREIIEAQVARAKKGDPRAADFVMKLFLHQPQRLSQHVHLEQPINGHREDPTPAEISRSAEAIKQLHLDVMRSKTK